MRFAMLAAVAVAAIIRALNEASGKGAGYRGGGGRVGHGAYYDRNPNDQLMKAVYSAWSRKNSRGFGVRLDEQGPVRLRLRGVPQGATKAVWREIRREPVSLPVMREGGICRVEVPSVGTWNGGYLEFD